ncbi:hypothetical protein BU25DRAFT_408464, partial [Macroventuria anomochaeta]
MTNITTSTRYCTTTMRAFGAEISGDRVPGGELSVRQRDSIVSKAEAGCTTKELAEEFSCSRRTIQKTIQRYNMTGNNQSKPRPGQPPRISRRERRYLH